MQALILAISLLLFSTIMSTDSQTEIATFKVINTLALLKEVQSFVCIQTLKDSIL